jgi:dihydroorotate dehydrogenase
MQPVSIGRVVWPGPVGVGAGLVKNGSTLLAFSQLADSVEVGSITRHLREGNQGKVVWKYPEQLSLRHNAGMPNYGAEHLAEDLIQVQDQMTKPWGINVAVSPGIADAAEAAVDIRDTVHLLLMSGLHPDWITINVASPDTQDSVEMLSDPERVKRLIAVVGEEVTAFDGQPVWLKIGPGISRERLAALAQLLPGSGVEAVICGNTLPDPAGGGWCGKVVAPRSNVTLRTMEQLVGDEVALIGTGGAMTRRDVLHKLSLGATAVQVVSAILLRGREVVHEMNL